jgi:hypothetical protein
MTILRIRILFLLFVSSIILTSCWDDFEERTYFTPLVTSFGFGVHDTCPDIEDYAFNIDQFNGDEDLLTSGTIFNPDSLPYGSVVNSLFPTMTLQSTNNAVYFNDVLWDNDDDSLDFTTPIVMRNSSYGGRYTKSYTVKVLVHQVDPDSFNLEPLSSKLPQAIGYNRILAVSPSDLFNYSNDAVAGFKVFTSNDTCKTWVAQTVSGLNMPMDLSSVSRLGTVSFALSTTNQAFTSPNGLAWTPYSPKDVDGEPITLLKLYGDLSFPTDTIEDVLTGLLRTSSGKVRFANSKDGLTWAMGDTISQNFPLTDYAQIRLSSETAIQRIRLVGGLNSSGALSNLVWSTEDGLKWATMSDVRKSWSKAPKVKNPIIFKYDNKLVCFGGTDINNVVDTTIRVSPDYGITWIDPSESWTFAKLNPGLAGAGVYVKVLPDLVNEIDREFIYFTGGNSANGASDLVWNAYLLQMIFDRR